MNELPTKSLRPLKGVRPTFKSSLILVTIISISAFVLLFYFPLSISISISVSVYAFAPESVSASVSDSTLYKAPVHVLNDSKVPDNSKASNLNSFEPIITEPSSHTDKVTTTGTVTSKDDPIQGTGLEQSYYIFSVDNNSSKKTYSGVITFTSSKPVQLQSINILTLNNTLKLPIQFGTLYTFPLNNTIIITSNLFDEPKATGTVSFSGNSLRFIATEHFLLTYSFSGEQLQSVVKNDIESGLETYRELIGTRS